MCVGFDCHHGYCEVVSGQASCHCNDGWSGDDCTTPDDNPTTSKPTTSNPTTQAPTTETPPKTSDKPDDPCDGVNCHHGDCVVNDDDETECQCKQGWHGDDCNERDDPTSQAPATTTEKADPCADKNCNNNFQCPHCTGDCIVNDDDEAECVCEEGWAGPQCKGTTPVPPESTTKQY